jgi:hypothetical protein
MASTKSNEMYEHFKMFLSNGMDLATTRRSKVVTLLEQWFPDRAELLKREAELNAANVEYEDALYQQGFLHGVEFMKYLQK